MNTVASNAKPDFVVNFQRPANTEIKHISGHWYLYERTSKYDPKIKRSRKVSAQERSPEDVLAKSQRVVLCQAGIRLPKF